MMRNNRVLQSLGIPAVVSIFRKSHGGRGGGRSTLSNDESSAITQGDSSDYHPSNDQLVDQEDGEVEGSIGEHIEKALKDPKSRKKKASVRKTSPGRRSKRLQKEQSSMPPVRVFADAPGGRKRHLEPVAEAPSKRATRRTSSEASATNNEDTPPRNNRSSSPQIDERIDEASTVRRDTGPTASDVMVHQHFDSDGFLDPEDDEGKFLLDSCGTTAAGGRKRKGTGLEQICKGMGVKLTIEIPPGLKRPEKPLPAAKFASEGGMLARGQMPLLPHFKLYKRDENLLADFVGKMGANFNMDTESEVIQKACYDVLRKVSKNRRYILKRDYFDKVPANEVSIKSPVKDVSDEEWEALTALWVTPRHRNTCTKNKDSRAAVKFGQKTGSRSYAAHLYATREERRGEELDAVDIFKATHHSKKDGFSEEALAAIADMEAELAIPVPEGAPPRSAVAVVAKVLSKEAKHSTFLKNAGLQPSSTVKLNKPTAAAVSAHVHDLEAQLKRSQEEAEQMKQQFAAIMEEAAAQKEKQAANEAAQAQRDKDYMELLKRTEESDRRLAHMIFLVVDRLAYGKSPDVDFEINGHHYTKGYYLADGIYPPWATLVKTIRNPTSEQEARFAKEQEAARKDVERAFGILQARWAIVERDDSLFDNDWEGQGELVTPQGAPASFQDILHAHHEIRDLAVHNQLQADLVEHMWQHVGNNAANNNDEGNREA
ncbi:hypothetical protein QYE76_040647 [Lolium multiflorum]|uniref:Uncharacterized protein n=1 Tax=Lolium multiflorum TaxID=4521 RepID=A0AAD8TDE7_LOLMU|nr:hypothetical protein QYE76_040647 [Lolium multiflorum]